MTRSRTLAAPVRGALTTLLALLAAAAALVSSGGAATAVDAAGSDDVTWTVRTASNSFGSDRTGFSYSIEPGASIDDALVVANHGDEPLELTVYAADGYTTESGQFDLLTPDLESVGVGTWLTWGSGPGSVTVEPGATLELPFIVSVPDDATPGDYSGGVLTSLAQADAAEGITVDRRLGIRLNLRVGGELAPSLEVEDVRVDHAGTLNPAAAGDAVVTYTLHNTGNTALSAHQAVAVSGPFGVLRVDAGAVDAPPQLLPGERWTVSIPIAGAWPTVRLDADVSVTPTLTDASGSTSSLTPVTGTAHTWAVPWSQLVVVLLVTGAAVLLPRLARRRRRFRAVAEERRVQDRVEAELLVRGAGQAASAPAVR